MSSLTHPAPSRTIARRFDLDAIASSLRAFQGLFSWINPALRDRREALSADVIDNMVAGYALTDRLIAEGADILAFGQLKSWLEINATVLCGDDPAQRERSAEHLEATQEHFYDDADGGIRDVLEWHERAQHQSVWKRAAGVYIRMMSEPQLFVEGNHRAGTLIMSYLLGREGKPPVVLTPDNAPVFFNLSTTAKQMRKHSLTMVLGMTGLKRQLAAFLKDRANDAYLLPAT